MWHFRGQKRFSLRRDCRVIFLEPPQAGPVQFRFFGLGHLQFFFLSLFPLLVLLLFSLLTRVLFYDHRILETAPSLKLVFLPSRFLESRQLVQSFFLFSLLSSLLRQHQPPLAPIKHPFYKHRDFSFESISIRLNNHGCRQGCRRLRR